MFYCKYKMAPYIPITKARGITAHFGKKVTGDIVSPVFLSFPNSNFHAFQR